MVATITVARHPCDVATRPATVPGESSEHEMAAMCETMGGKSKSLLATANLLENTDGVLLLPVGGVCVAIIVLSGRQPATFYLC